VPELVEHGLEHVRKSHELGESEDPRTALDGVHRAEHRVDGLVRCATLAHLGQSDLDVLKELGAFVEERLFQLLQTGHDTWSPRA
jgi:hypothetical protein